MTTSTPTITFTGHLGRDAQIRLTTAREYERTLYDPILDDHVTLDEVTPVRDYASLSLAVHQGRGTNRSTTWYQLRAWDLDDHPDERRLRAAHKGQRVEVQGYPEEHRYTDTRTGEERVFRYLVVTSFRPVPGKLLRPRITARAA